jgi:hypothetical protein
MPTLKELLEDAVGEIDHEFDAPSLILTATTRRLRRHRRRVALAVAATVVAGIAAALVPTLADGDNDRSDLTTSNVVTTKLTDVGKERVVLVIDDGYDGIVVVDPLAHVVVRARVDGQRVGDQRYRLLTVGDTLIVGWGEIFAAPIAGGTSRKLGDATIAIPAEQPDRVWLVDYPGGKIGLGTPTLRLVDLTGRVETEVIGMEPLAVPIVGALGGIVYETNTGLVVWDPQTRTIIKTLSVRQSQVLASAGGKLAWCEDPCNTLRISRVVEPDAVFVTVGHRYTLAQFSPDGRRLAAVHRPSVETESPSTAEIKIVDAVGGAAIAGFKSNSEIAALTWAPTSDAVIATADAPDSSGTVITNYLLTGATTISTIPIGDVRRFIATAATATPYSSTARLTEPESCTAAHIHSTDRATPCSYGYP